MAQMADVFDVAESTIWEWKKKHPGFSEAITCARADADGLVVEAMFNSALGQRFTETKIRSMVGKNGEEVIEKTVTERVIPGDVGAQKHWLHNRQPTLWKNIPADNDGDKLPEITSIVFQAVDGSITESTPGAEDIPASENTDSEKAPGA